MGLLATGTPLSWPDVKKSASHVRDWGIQQLLANFNRAKGKEHDALLWGDEIEYLVVCLDDKNRKVRLSLRQADILRALAENEELAKKGGGVPDIATGQKNKSGETAPTFHPEFGRFMLEATPGKPWGIGLNELLDVEPNMKWRREIARDHMEGTERPITLTTFPLLGLPDTLIPAYQPSGEKLRSQFLPDEIANPHIRFPTLAANIRERRGRKVEINVPVFKDEKTPWPWTDPTVDYDMHNWPEDDDVRRGAAKENHIHMDAMAFGMGSCCLQITFQAKNIEEGRTMYDQLSPLGPIMLALTAATPIYKGFLADTDVRWNQISAAVDDRTPEELGETPLQNDRWRIPKSRYASNSTYISQDSRLRPEYMDPDLVVDEDIKRQLQNGGMDPLLATHFAHLFIRDPIVVFAEDLQELDLSAVDHFENLQSTNWQHMRFKPPPPAPATPTSGENGGKNDIGWRVEFRSMEIQMTDFENAAFAIFIVLMTRTILSFNLNFYVPIARTTENMQTAHKRDAVLNEKFWFRRDPVGERRAVGTGSADGIGTVNGHSGGHGMNGTEETEKDMLPVEDEYELMTCDEIINGQKTTPDASDPATTDSGSTAEPTTNGTTPTANGTHTTHSTSTPANPPSPPTRSTNPTTPPFPGLLPLIESYLSSLNISISTRCALARYLELIRLRASGGVVTPARWIRHFVRTHEEYKGDSVVGAGVAYDLCRAVEGMSRGERDDKGMRKGWVSRMVTARMEIELRR